MNSNYLVEGILVFISLLNISSDPRNEVCFTQFNPSTASFSSFLNPDLEAQLIAKPYAQQIQKLILHLKKRANSTPQIELLLSRSNNAIQFFFVRSSQNKAVILDYDTFEEIASYDRSRPMSCLASKNFGSKIVQSAQGQILKTIDGSTEETLSFFESPNSYCYAGTSQGVLQIFYQILKNSYLIDKNRVVANDMHVFRYDDTVQMYLTFLEPTPLSYSIELLPCQERE